MVQEILSAIPEDLYNLTQLAEVTLAAGRLSTTNINEITDYINKEKNTVPIELSNQNAYNNVDNNDNISSTFRRKGNIMHDNWNRNIEDIRSDIKYSDNGLHSVIKRNHSIPNILDYNENDYKPIENNLKKMNNFLSSSDDDSNYYSHKIFDRKKARRSTFSDNSRHDELSCSSIQSSGDEHFLDRTPKSTDVCSSISSDDDHVCPECGKKYSTSSNLARHRQTHRSILDKKARRCPHCDKVYVSMPAYSMHVRTHNQGCECPHCGKCFSRPWLLQGHIRTHTGEKPFKCNICSKAFADKSNLRAHVQTHSNTKPHSCARCGKSFALKSYLYKHEESSCMRNHLKHDKERGKIPKSETPPRCSTLAAPKTPSKENRTYPTLNTATNIELSPNQFPDTNIITEEDDTKKSYTTLTTPMTQDDYDRFSRISVIRTPNSNHVYEPNNMQLNIYQEGPVDFSPKNNFSHSSKTSPFELTSSYAIVA